MRRGSLAASSTTAKWPAISMTRRSRDQRVEQRLRIGRHAPCRDFGEGERTEIGEQVAEIVGVAGLAVRHEALQFEFELREHFGVEELAAAPRSP